MKNRNLSVSNLARRGADAMRDGFAEDSTLHSCRLVWH
jgi:hypothetical protein